MTVVQASLWGAPAPAVHRPSIELRPYQREACDAADEVHSRVRSTIIVHPTGTGKTTEFCEMIERRPSPALVIAHRTELIEQAAKRIRQQTGRTVSIEKAERYGDHQSQVVVASVATLGEDRLRRWSPDHFKLLVVDECHHATAPSYRRILDHFTGAKVLGVTATPDRADEQALGQVFDEVAHIYEISDAINDGWLVPIKQKRIYCDYDLSAARTVAADFNGADLDAAMSMPDVLRQVVEGIIQYAGDRKTMIFGTSVVNVHLMAELFNRFRPESGRAVDGGTGDLVRRRVVEDYAASRFQYLCNVGVYTEGFDEPSIGCVAVARPTKSRSLYAQMVGRGTRPMSGKPDLLVLDFVGNAGKHVLVGPEDILAGKYSDEVVAAARKELEKEGGGDVLAALSRAEVEAKKAAERKALAEAAMRNRRPTKFHAVDVDPFGVLGLDRPRYAGRFGDEPATPRQVEVLTKMKVPAMENLSKREAGRLIGECFKRREEGKCTFGQAKTLAKYGYDKNMSFDQARAVMDALAGNGWRRLSPEVLAPIMSMEAAQG